MTDTTASSDAKQSQPAASLSGSELDRLRDWVEDINEAIPHTKDSKCETCQDAMRSLEALLAERQQDLQRIADLEKALRSVLEFQDLEPQERTADEWEYRYHDAALILQERQSATPRLADAQGKEGE